jgi:hypothetical protein
MTQPFYTMRRLGVFLLLSAAILVAVLLFMPYRTDCGLPLSEAFQDSSGFHSLPDSMAYKPGSGLPGPPEAILGMCQLRAQQRLWQAGAVGALGVIAFGFFGRSHSPKEDTRR